MDSKETKKEVGEKDLALKVRTASISYTEDEANQLIGLLDLVVKAYGIQPSKIVVYHVEKIQNAFK